MNASLMVLEIAVVVLALVILMADLWTSPAQKPLLGYGALLGLLLILGFSLTLEAGTSRSAFGDSYVFDGLALYFKRFFLVAAIMVLVMSMDFADRIPGGISEFYSLVLLALAGMMCAASAHDFAMLFVSVELITVTFYVLTSFQRHRLSSLEAGIKYLILGALSSAIMVYGIALVYGTAGTMDFGALAQLSQERTGKPLFLLGLLLVVLGLAFKIAVFPMQVWAPDVYQGAPVPVTAFLAVGSKAAGFVLLVRLLFSALPREVTVRWAHVLMAIAAITILYGNLCAIPQRNLKRLLGYSSIANAGYLMLGIAAMSHSGSSAVLFYLGGYLFTLLGAFTVICVVMRQVEGDDISALAGLNQRSPLLAATMSLAMVSLAGIPPLVGFFGKFLLFKAAIEQGSGYYWLIAVAIAGVVISLWYYFGVIRVIYWSKEPAGTSRISLSRPVKLSLLSCIAAMLYLGVFPNALLQLANRAAGVLRFPG